MSQAAIGFHHIWRNKDSSWRTVLNVTIFAFSEQYYKKHREKKKTTTTKSFHTYMDQHSVIKHMCFNKVSGKKTQKPSPRSSYLRHNKCNPFLLGFKETCTFFIPLQSHLKETWDHDLVIDNNHWQRGGVRYVRS